MSQPALVAVAVPRPLLGIVLMIAGLQFMSVMDGVAKYLAADFPVLQIAWARFFFHVCAIAPFVLWRFGWRALWPANAGLQLLRSALVLSATLCFFSALAFIPLVDAVAMVYIAPLVVTVLSPWVLGEQFGVRRALAVATGFAGALLVLRPGSAVFHWASLLALGAGLSFGGFLLLTRRIAGDAPVAVTLTFTALVGAAVLSFALPGVWQPPGARALALMASLGALAASGHLLLILAYQHAPASLLAPFGYSEIATATAIGWFVFGDFPDGLSWAGIATIIASGIYVWLRERRWMAS